MNYNTSIEALRARFISNITEAHDELSKSIETKGEKSEVQYAYNGVSMVISPDFNPSVEIGQSVSLSATSAGEAFYLLLDVIENAKSGAFDALLEGGNISTRAEVDYMSGYPQILGWNPKDAVLQML